MRILYPHLRGYRSPAARGTALAMIVILSVILTGLVLTLAWTTAVQTQISSAQVKFDQAFYAAEAGANKALWRFKHDNTYRAPKTAPLTGSIVMGNVTYTYSVTCTDPTGNASSVPATSLWNFSEGSGGTVADSAGDSPATFMGGANWVAGRSGGYAVTLNGSSAYLDAGTKSSLNISSAVSMSAWVNLASSNSDQKVGGNQNGTYGGYKMSIYNSKVEFEVRDAYNNPTLNRDVSGGTTLSTGTWYHVAGVFNPADGTIKTYVNGKLDRTLTGVSTSALAATNSRMILGREPFSSTLFLQGNLDETGVFNRALSAAEVQALYAGAAVTITSTATSPNGDVTSIVSCNAAPVQTSTPAKVPVLTLGSNLNMKNATINGDVQLSGDFNGSNSTVNGNVTYGSNLNGVTVTGTATKKSGLSVPVLDYATIQQKAAIKYSSTQNNTTIDFTAISGANPTIYINGDANSPTFKGSGTLYVTGNINMSNGADTIGTASAPIHLVAKGDINLGNGNNSINGSLYTGNNVNGKISSITGVVVAGGCVNASNNGSCSYTAAPAPWFDPRAGSSGGSGGSSSNGPISVTRFIEGNP